MDEMIDETAPVKDGQLGELSKTWVERLGQVAPPPLLLELSAMHLAVEEFDPRELSEKISRDAVLAGNLLAIVNSARFGLTTPMTSVQRAVVHIGFNLAKSIIVSYMLENSFSDPLPVPVEHIEFVRRWSAGASVLAHHWAQAADLEDPSTASTLALLARVGTLVLGLDDSPPDEKYRALPDEIQRMEYELAHWQITTPLLSAEQISRWGVPEPIPGYVRRQAEPLTVVLPSGKENRMLVLVTASIVLAASLTRCPDDSPGVVIDSPVYSTLKNNLVDHGLLECLNALWIGLRLQRELASVRGE